VVLPGVWGGFRPISTGSRCSRPISSRSGAVNALKRNKNGFLHRKGPTGSRCNGPISSRSGAVNALKRNKNGLTHRKGPRKAKTGERTPAEEQREGHVDGTRLATPSTATEPTKSRTSCATRLTQEVAGAAMQVL
jgi:hypothetical protein